MRRRIGWKNREHLTRNNGFKQYYIMIPIHVGGKNGLTKRSHVVSANTIDTYRKGLELASFTGRED